MAQPEETTSHIKVISLDDHHLIRAGIRAILAAEETMTLVAEGWAGEQLEPLVAAHLPDVVLLDLEMPQMVDPDSQTPFRALTAVAQLRQQYPQTRVIILSQYATPALVEGAVAADVSGYLLKDDELSLRLIEAIKMVHQGGFYLSGEVGKQLARVGHSTNKLLTERQEQIIMAIVTNPNLSYAVQAQQLGISENTFSNHLRQIFERLQVNNVTAAIVKSIRLGIISIESGDNRLA